jgi:hypothetical protein
MFTFAAGNCMNAKRFNSSPCRACVRSRRRAIAVLRTFREGVVLAVYGGTGLDGRDDPARQVPFLSTLREDSIFGRNLKDGMSEASDALLRLESKLVEYADLFCTHRCAGAVPAQVESTPPQAR